ncbi:MAG: sulfatase-like hydrolase/transferase, partial [Blastocatellia bacterium]
MKRIEICLLLIGATTAAIGFAVAGQSAQSRKPNIIFILADDLGWGDLSVYGHERLKTPSLDRLAAQGTLFTQFYV